MKSLLGKLGVIFPVIGLIIFGYGFPVMNIANAQSTLALQEKCTEGAKKFFFRSEKTNQFASPNKELGYWYDDGGYGTTEYIPHYNKKFDKCFILIKSQYNHTWESRSEKIRAKRENWRITSTQALFNVFEGTEVAVFDHMIDRNNKIERDPSYRCYVGTKRCKSLEEFQELIKPYMEE
jgi:hypothetical protein